MYSCRQAFAMPLSTLAHRFRLAPLAAGLVLLTACATGGGGRASPGVNTLYAQLDQASKGYETALQQAREGDDQASEQSLKQSLDSLKQAAARCGNTPGCDPQRFFSVFDRLLRLKDGGFFAGDDLATVGEEGPDEKVAGEAGETGGAAALPQAQRSVTLLRGHKLSELIAMNGPVKAALEMWLTQWRSNLVDTWINYQYMRYEMWPQYEKADLPEALLFGIMAKESGGKVHAVSRSGAAGPLQFMYATGLRFGPSLAAYNGGEGRMRRMVNGNTDVSFYDPAIYSQLSEETREYVPAVLAAAWLFLHPDSYNLHFPKIDGAPGHVTLKRPASL